MSFNVFAPCRPKNGPGKQFFSAAVFKAAVNLPSSLPFLFHRLSLFFRLREESQTRRGWWITYHFVFYDMVGSRTEGGKRSGGHKKKVPEHEADETGVVGDVGWRSLV